MAIDSIFPTSIYYESLKRSGGKAFNDEILEECLQIRDYDDEGRAWSEKHYIGGYTSYASINNVHQMSSTFIEFEERVTKHVKEFAKYLDMDLRDHTISMSDCWVNIMPARVAHGLHIHPLSFMSGTYYASTPEECSPIKFEDPRLDRFMNAPPKKANSKKHNKQFVSYNAKAGKLVLFESWLRHEVPASNIDEERVSISFNYAWS